MQSGKIESQGFRGLILPRWWFNSQNSNDSNILTWKHVKHFLISSEISLDLKIFFAS